MSNADRHSKTELPTKQRLKKARREGQVARSGDLASWIVLALSAMLIPRYIAWLISRTSRQFTFVRAAESDATDEMLGAVGHHVVIDLALLLALPLGLSLVLGVAFSLAQTGIVAAPDALKPKLSRLSLKQGFKRTMSRKTAWEALKQFLRIAVILAVSVPFIIATTEMLLKPGVSIGTMFEQLISRTVTLIQIIAITGVLLSLVDFAFQKRNTRRDLMMTKQEVRQEQKNSDGDPTVKSRRRALQSELSRNRALATVAESSVVIVNPTHFAIAVHYERGMSAPMVTERASGERAVSVRDEALAAGVPVIRCIPLARSLHRATRKGKAVPKEYYGAVAVVIAFVTRLGTRKAFGIIHDIDPDLLDVLPLPGRDRAA